MIRSTLLLAFLSALLFICACSNPASNKPAAITNEAAPQASLSPAAKSERYRISPDTSTIEFVGSKVTGSHHGSFKKFSGTIDFNEDVAKGSVNVTIEMASLETDEPDLTKHLQTPDFFDVAKYPEATFVSTAIKPEGDKGGSYTVTGNLTLHGVTKSITFPAIIRASSDGITVDSTFSINRKDFGINYAGAANNLIRDQVVLTLKIRGVK